MYTIQHGGYSPFIPNLLQPGNFLRLVLKLFLDAPNVYGWVFTITSLKKPHGLRFPGNMLKNCEFILK